MLSKKKVYTYEFDRPTKDNILKFNLGSTLSLCPYRGVLDTTAMLGVVPSRYNWNGGEISFENGQRKCLHPCYGMTRATNWVKFSATAGLGVIYGGHLHQGRSLMAPYLPQSGASGGGGELFYALEMVNLLDPKKVYFDSRVIALTDCPKKHHKTLDVVLVQKTVVLILDDTERVWGKMDKENLILMDRYHFFCFNL
ncbi:hypothetical protein Lser_V15G21478 [Lactuca serriola]